MFSYLACILFYIILATIHVRVIIVFIIYQHMHK